MRRLDSAVGASRYDILVALRELAEHETWRGRVDVRRNHPGAMGGDALFADHDEKHGASLVHKRDARAGGQPLGRVRPGIDLLPRAAGQSVFDGEAGCVAMA